MELRNVKGILFSLLFLVLFLPFLEHCFGFIESGKLKGYYVSPPDANFSYAKWWDGSYQVQKANFLNENVGFRPDIVRINNQIDYSVFNKIHANSAVIGKDGYLFDEEQIYKYIGSDTMRDTAFRADMTKLKYVQDTLARLGKTLLFVEAPSKPYYYPEKFNYRRRYSHRYSRSLYSIHIHLVDSLKINHIDINAWFQTLKKTNPDAALFPKLGIHWSAYGSLLVADTLIKYLDRERDIQLPSLQIIQMNYSDTPRFADGDMATVTNLVFPIKSEKLCYPDFRFFNDGRRDMPKMIFIGDSFMWPFIDNGVPEGISKDWEFWYYFKEVWRHKTIWGLEEVHHINNYDWQKSISEADCLIFLYTTANLDIFHNNKESPIEVLYEHYYPNGIK